MRFLLKFLILIAALGLLAFALYLSMEVIKLLIRVLNEIKGYFKRTDYSPIAEWSEGDLAYRYDISRIVTNVQAEIHLLRHLTEVEKTVKIDILSSGFSEERVNSELAMPGSRFSADFANSVSSLFLRLKEKKITTISGENGNIILSHEFEKADFPQGIGTLSVIPISEVSPDKRKKMKKKSNRGMKLWHLQVDRYPTSWICTVIIRPGKVNSKNLQNHSGGSDQFITAFPGPAAMPLPDFGMPPDLFRRCSEFWENHVFLETDESKESTKI